ncbi:hypothetical protein RFI_02796 [Reticulomyxa filosa]|uniref:RING-type domain-containing protein n=1 Tax=Reticulomyxa filosa TaxID=46433 RepID=X6P888_RETFI|nr:hypothetical protein RFI_02796 [Reticulomyxa filosa]|eukprot:ETO34289.1 hypothetical protein RFI_02796 [Reticulomyxa filosa]
MSEEKGESEKNVGSGKAKRSSNETTVAQMNEIEKWLLENNLPTFLEKFLKTQNINSLGDIYTLEQERIDAIVKLLPQYPVTNQLKKSLYRSSDRVIMDEIESIYSKWRLATEENKQLKKFKDLLIQQVGERNSVIKKLQEQNAKLTKDVLQATLALTQVQLDLARQGVMIDLGQNALNLSALSAPSQGAQSDANAADADADAEAEAEVNAVHPNASAGETQVDEDDTANDNVNANASANNDNDNTGEMKQCDLCEIEYDQTICVSDTCRHVLCVNCCTNSVTGDISNNQQPQCPVCQNAGNHTSIAASSQLWRKFIDADVWALFQQLSDNPV